MEQLIDDRGKLLINNLGHLTDVIFDSFRDFFSSLEDWVQWQLTDWRGSLRSFCTRTYERYILSAGKPDRRRFDVIHRQVWVCDVYLPTTLLQLVYPRTYWSFEDGHCMDALSIINLGIIGKPRLTELRISQVSNFLPLFQFRSPLLVLIEFFQNVQETSLLFSPSRVDSSVLKWAPIWI